MKRLLLLALAIALGRPCGSVLAESKQATKALPEVVDIFPTSLVPHVEHIQVPVEYVDLIQHITEPEAFNTYLLNRLINEINAAAAVPNKPVTAIADVVEAEAARIDIMVQHLITEYARVTNYVDRIIAGIRLTGEFLDTTNNKEPFSYFAREYMKLCIDPDGQVNPELKELYAGLDKIKDMQVAVKMVPEVLPEAERLIKKYKVFESGPKTVQAGTQATAPSRSPLKPMIDSLTKHYFGDKNVVVELVNALVARVRLTQQAVGGQRRRIAPGRRHR